MLCVIFLVSFFYLLEVNNFEIAIQNSSSNQLIIAKLKILFFIFIIVSWVYCFLFLELKKKPNILEKKVWNRMPFILLVVGFFSICIFIGLGAFGPLFLWVESWRFLIYLFIIYFITLYYIFILSVFLYNKKSSKSTLSYSYVLTLSSLMIFLFLFP